MLLISKIYHTWNLCFLEFYYVKWYFGSNLLLNFIRTIAQNLYLFLIVIFLIIVTFKFGIILYLPTSNICVRRRGFCLFVRLFHMLLIDICQWFCVFDILILTGLIAEYEDWIILTHNPIPILFFMPIILTRFATLFLVRLKFFDSFILRFTLHRWATTTWFVQAISLDDWH